MNRTNLHPDLSNVNSCRAEINILTGLQSCYSTAFEPYPTDHLRGMRGVEDHPMPLAEHVGLPFHSISGLGGSSVVVALTLAVKASRRTRQ